MGDDKQQKYKKRVIQASSSDEDDGDDIPLIKRAKADDGSQGSAAATLSVVPGSDVIAVTSNSPTALAAANAPLPAPLAPNGFTNNHDSNKMDVNHASAAPGPAAVKKSSVFTTGELDDDDDDDDKPLAAVVNKKQPAPAGRRNQDNGHAASAINGKSKPVSKVKREDSDDEGMNSEERAPTKVSKEVQAQVKQEKAVEDEVAKVANKIDRQQQKRSRANDDDDDSDAGSSSSEDEKPLAQRAQAKASTSKAKGKKTAANGSKKGASSSKKSSRAGNSDDDEESELTPSDDGDDDSDSDDSDAPLSKKAKVKKAKAPAPKKRVPAKAAATKRVKKEESSTPQPESKKKGKGRAKKEDTEDIKSEAGDEDGVFKWWEQDQDGETKWKTLEHNGVLFPPEYEPHGVQMKYDGRAITLPPEAEEVASFFAAILETDYVKNPVFVRNFFDSWLGVLKNHPPTDGTKITTFEKCDFTPIFAYLEAEKAKKKAMTPAEKKAAKVEREKIEAAYKTCLLDGRKEKVGNFRIEPPGLFRGRGEHPKTGLLKTRVRPEQITINLSKGAKVPIPPKGHQWKDVVHDDKVTWLATWKENVNGNVKYVFLAAGSSLKGQSDFKKFEKARALKEHIAKIRRDYTADLKNKEMATRQRATAIYLIDRLALRNGNEKGEDEADTVGCCSLRFEHVTLTPPTTVTFDFLGKDSIRFHNEVQVEEQVFKNLKIFKKEPKDVGDLLFDRLNTGIVNKFLNSYMDGLTAKVFRTYNASWTFQEQLKDTPTDASIADKILHYNRANRMVAVLCNHQRSVSKGHSQAMEKLIDKIRDLKYQRKKLRAHLFATAEKPKQYKAEYGEDESDLEDDWIVQHEADLVVAEREKIRKKFDKENQKLQEEGSKPMKEAELQDRLKAADELEKTLKRERKAGWRESKLTEAKIVAALEKMDGRIQLAKTNAVDRDEGKEISLGTSKINYLDPRITFAWCKANNVPFNKLFSKTLVEKFTWATEVDGDFVW